MRSLVETSQKHAIIITGFPQDLQGSFPEQCGRLRSIVLQDGEDENRLRQLESLAKGTG